MEKEKIPKNTDDVHLFVEVAQAFALSVVIFLFIYYFLGFQEIVMGKSMEPTLHEHNRLIVERLSVTFNKLERGDIVIFNPPGINNTDYVKRIIALPHEKVEIDDCKVFVTAANNTRYLLTEPYLDNSICTKELQDKIIDVPEDAYFVMGDNREHSADSRYFGVIYKDRIAGRVLLRFWPLTKVSFF